MAYRVKEIFYTLQGEGAQAGRPAVFCRFSGCNLWSGRPEDRATAKCRFCDTDFVGADAGVFATAEELAVFEAKDAAAAASLAEKLQARNSERLADYADYLPAEVPKLENAVIISGGRYVVLCVATDASAVKELAEKTLG